MAIPNIANQSWDTFRANFNGLLFATAPYIAASVILSVIGSALPSDSSMALHISLGIVELVMNAMVTLAGLKFLYALDGTRLEINGKVIFRYIMAMLYIGFAIMVGLMFFILPGIVFMAVSFLAPVYILKEGQGPIQSVASSALLVKNDLLVIGLFLCGIFMIVLGSGFLVGWLLEQASLAQPITSGVSGAITLVAGLYTLPLMKLLYSDLLAEYGEKDEPED